MVFKRSVQRYGRTPAPETPYQRAGQLWDERIGSARAQARNWRRFALVSLVLTAALSGSLIWQSMQSRVVPYVVEVDRLGEARAINPAGIGYHPTDPQVAWFLSRFVTDVRSISLDPVLMKQDWLAAYDFTTKRGAAFLGDYARTADPFGHVGERTVSVQVTSILRASDRSFQVKWIETAYERGAPTGTTRWTAILTVLLSMPSTADRLRKNPLGLYVDGIDWTRELDPTGMPALPLRAPASPTTLGPPLDPSLIPTVSPETRP